MIRAIQLKDKERWKKLYIGYADFYKVEMNEKILETVWEWLNDTNHELKGIGYEVDGKIVGLAHYRKLLRPLKGKYIAMEDQDIYKNDIFGLKTVNEAKKIEMVTVKGNHL